MKIKKYQAASETEAMLRIKEELGKDALILSIKTIQPKGIYKLFKKTIVEVTAAVDDEQVYAQDKNSNLSNRIRSSNSDKNDNVEALEKKLNNIQTLIEKQILQAETKEENGAQEEKPSENITYVQLIYNQLINNEVDEEYVNQILSEIDSVIYKGKNLDNILSIVYQKIVIKLGVPRLIKLDKKPKVVFFIGPTGVGKTTTIAKIASTFKINKNKRVALLTSDTYRVSAVEQLRTYANILGIPINVIYSPDEINEAIEELFDYDLILIDTAGHSYKNEGHYEDTINLINEVDEKEVFLVLSSTTKYKDLKKIVTKYSKVPNYSIIFTKTDETSCLGNILNIKMFTGADLSYVTFGQNVPDDISEVNSQQVAKHLLGGNE